MSDTSLHDIIEDTKKLVQAAAHPRKGTLPLSPNTAALLESIEAVVSGATGSTGAIGDAVAQLQALEETVRACQQCGLCEDAPKRYLPKEAQARISSLSEKHPESKRTYKACPSWGRQGNY